MTEQLSPYLIISIVAGYFLLLMIVSYFTGKDSGNENFFLAGRNSPWYLVAFGMIGASLSGVTFISVPGAVGATPELMESLTGEPILKANICFSYMQMVFGYLLGYFVIATVLLPLYYRLNLTTIYGYLAKRFGFFSHKTGSAYFLLSRILGASFRLYLVAMVFQLFIMDAFGIPFWVTVLTTIILIWVYTFRGGINTIVWTDTLQTICMLAAVVLTVFAISNALEKDVFEMVDLVRSSEYGQMFFFEKGWSDPNNFYKQFITGALIAIVMTGLDQDMMQKNLSCRTLRESQLNMFTFSIILVFANLLFLTLGALLYIYALNIGIDIPAKTDQLYPTIALQHLSPAIGITFILGLIAAAYSSADSALTSLTTAFCVDFLDFENNDQSPEDQKRTRFKVHVVFSLLLFITIVIFHELNNDSVINGLLKAAGYTYGPLLGMFAFGIFTHLKIRDNLVLIVCILAPVLSYIIDIYSSVLLGGFSFGNLIIALNGFLTFLGLLAISYWDGSKPDLESI